MATDSAQTQSRSFFRRFLDGLWRLIRLLIILAILIALGVLIFYGGKIGYESILLPLNDTIGRVEALEGAMQEERDGMTGQLTLRDERITKLESQLTKQKGLLNTQKSELEAQQVELERFATLTSEIEALQKALKTANSEVKTITSELADLQAQTSALEEASQTLGQQSESATTELDTVNNRIDELQDAASDTATMLDRVQQDRLLFHAQANLLNAQRSLNRSDMGMANEYLQRAEVSLKAVSNVALESEEGPIALVLTRLNEALDRLENDPFSAAADLQGVWRALDSVILGELSVGLPLPSELPDQTAEENSENQEEATSSEDEEEASAEDEANSEDETNSEDEASTEDEASSEDE